MTSNRREFVKQMAAAWAAASLASLVGCGGGPQSASSAILSDSGVTWSKAPCRF